MRLRELESSLQSIDFKFSNPKVELEQYPTGQHIASRVLYTAHSSFGDIEDKSVVDLGCGTGVLGIGCILLGASYVLGIDKDENAILQAQQNSLHFGDLPIDFLLCDAFTTTLTIRNKSYDTVITNPPFGTRHKNADTKFLSNAFHLATTAVYSLHKKSTRGYIQKFADQHCSVMFSQIVAELKYDLLQSYQFHKKLTKDIEVDFWRFEIKK